MLGGWLSAGPVIDHVFITITAYRCETKAPEPFQISGPNCDTEYVVVRVAESSGNDRPLVCLGCGGPLHGREGKFTLKFFRVGGRSKKLGGRKPRLI
jgi:hypothetical protein